MLFTISTIFAGFLSLQNNSVIKNNKNLKDIITSINSDLGQIKAENVTLNGKMAILEKNYSDLTAENDKLVILNKQLNENISTITTQFETLKTNYDKLLSDYNKLSKKSGLPEKTSQDPTTPKVAYLTFDDGVSKYTNTILDILKEYDIKATFFPNWKSGKDDVYKRIIEEGHAIGNHTYDHEYKNVYSTVDGFIQSVTSLQEKIKNATGGYVPEIFRFPGGSNNTVHRTYNKEIIPQAIKAIHDLGMEYYDWNVDSLDASKNAPLTADKLVSNVVSGSSKNNVIILMHDTAAKATTIEALPKIIEGLIKKGYTFDKLSKNVVPPQFVKP